ncbi:MAG: hypothetical protein EPO23_01225 [Xanthobacteraceae bacterium]|nr:MAG: hypothetical protein EPO23_01225 [Xanthobacteraceae bacterium]
MRDRRDSVGKTGGEASRLREALRAARVEAADRTGVVVDLRDAEVARLEILNDALDPVFADIPGHIDLFDRAISQGDTPRLWVDVVAHVAMGRDKRTYRFVQDTRFGRVVIAESHDVPVMVDAVTQYVARRMVERERALANFAALPAMTPRPGRRHAGWWSFALGFLAGAAALFGAALVAALRSL